MWLSLRRVALTSCVKLTSSKRWPALLDLIVLNPTCPIL